MARYRQLKTELNRDYRNDLNKNFEDIERDIVKAETNIKRVETETLQKVDEIVGGGFIESLETARDNANESSVEANTQASYAKSQGDHAKAQGDLANAAALNADSKATYAEEKALLADEAAAKAEQESSNLGTLKNNVVDATQVANTAATNAEEKALEAEIAITDTIAATHAANEATEAVQAVVDNTGYAELYSDETAYKRNNIVSYNGSSYMAKQDTKGNLPTDTNYWGLLAEKGEQGTGLNILGSLNDETELPSTGELGNAYLIAGNLYVWDGTAWQNAGNIKGPKGDTGERGLKGDKGDQGISAYEVAIANGFVGTETEWLASLKGEQGEQGIQGEKGEKGDGSDQTELVRQINSLYRQNTNQDREIAYLKLKQQASDRIEGGTVFAHDMNGNIIGMTIDEANSQNIIIRDGKMLMINQYEETRTVTDATIVDQAYDTSGNGGRKLVRLSNGWLITGFSNPEDSYRYYFYVSKNGETWEYLTHTTGGFATNTPAGYTISSSGTMVIIAVIRSGGQVLFGSFNALTINGSTFAAGNELDKSGQTNSGHSISMVTDVLNNEVHMAWANKVPTYPNSFNIRYAKGVISAVDGSVAWGTVEQISIINSPGQNIKTPCIIIDSKGYPGILVEANDGTSNQLFYLSKALTTQDWFLGNASWGNKQIYDGGSYIQSSPSAIFVPKEINSLENGLIGTAWHGRDATHPSTDYIRFIKSLDGGINWSTMKRLVAGQNASITADKYGNLYIEYERGGNVYFIKSTDNGDSWGAETLKGVGSNPSTLFDLSMDTVKPLSIRKGTSSVVFSGEWKELVEAPSLTAKVLYDIPSTDYVGAFVKKTGAVNVQTYVNDVLADAELVDDEYCFTKQLDTETPVKLRLELSRPNVSGGESDTVTRILGGRS